MVLNKKILFFNFDFLLLIANMFFSERFLGTPLLGITTFLLSNLMFLIKNDAVRIMCLQKTSRIMRLTIIISLASVILTLTLLPQIYNFSIWFSLLFLIANILLLIVKDFFVKDRDNKDFTILNEIRLESPFSLKLFYNMSFFTKTALITGLLILISFMCFNNVDISVNQYITAFLWLLLIDVLQKIFNYVIKPGESFSIFIFIVGAVLWIVATILFFKSSTLSNIMSIMCFSLSLSFITSSLSRFNKDFGMVLRLIGEEKTDDKMQKIDNVNLIMASLFSNCIMSIIFSIWIFVIPHVDSYNVRNTFPSIIVQLPVIFMIISIFYALNQPLDKRIRDKLVNYLTVSSDKTMGLSLYRVLIKKYRVRYGVKIIATLVRPWLHLKVKGKENIKSGEFPSVFVCNHGIIYGPVAAVIYLPTYFRPWIDKKMLDIDLATNEMYSRFMYRLPLLSEKIKRALTRFIAHPVVWAMKSFNPIGVERDNLRDVMTTFNDTIVALKESDNILLFPERPERKVVSGKETVVHKTDSVGNLFKGFAKLGSMYWNETGKRLAFYPIYADKKNHTFTIGERVVYEPNNNINDERDRIAGELKIRMESLM